MAKEGSGSFNQEGAKTVGPKARQSAQAVAGCLPQHQVRVRAGIFLPRLLGVVENAPRKWAHSQQRSSAFALGDGLSR